MIYSNGYLLHKYLIRWRQCFPSKLGKISWKNMFGINIFWFHISQRPAFLHCKFEWFNCVFKIDLFVTLHTPNYNLLFFVAMKKKSHRHRAASQKWHIQKCWYQFKTKCSASLSNKINKVKRTMTVTSLIVLSSGPERASCGLCAPWPMAVTIATNNNWNKWNHDVIVWIYSVLHFILADILYNYFINHDLFDRNWYFIQN